MGATKKHQYSEKELKKALLARAFAHPARIRIYEILKSHEIYPNKELHKELQLNQSTIHDHLIKLKDAGVVSIEYFENIYSVQLNPNYKELIEI